VRAKDELLHDVLGRIERATKLPPKAHGSQWMCRCPAHADQAPSLSVAAGQRGIVLRCFAGCDAGQIADAIGLTMRQLFYGTPTDSEPVRYESALHELAARRGWTPEALLALGATAENGDVIFTMRNSKGQVVGRKRRRANGMSYMVNGREVKSLTEAGAKSGIMARWPIPAEGTVLVVEGEADAASALSTGWTAVVGTPGVELGAIAARALQRVLSNRSVVLVPDPGEPGRAWLKRLGSLLANAQARIRYVPSDDKHDLDDRLQRAEDPAAYLVGLVGAALAWTESAPSPPEGVRNSDRPEWRQFPRTDLGNGELLAYLHGAELRFDHRRGVWLCWAGHWWQVDADRYVQRLMSVVLRQRYHKALDLDTEQREGEAKWALRSEARGRIEAALFLAQAIEPIADDGEDWDANPDLLGVLNGVLDLTDGTLREGHPEDRISVHLPWPFDSEAKCPRWERFIGEIFAGKPELPPFVQRSIGYSLTGSTKEQCFYVLYGTGQNGKGCFLETLRHVFGELSFDPGFSAFEQAGLYAHPEQVAELAGKRFVTASETAERSRLNEARLKALSHGDTTSAAFKYARRFQFTPQAKVWLSVNSKPKVADDSRGFWRSVKLIPFDQVFEGATDDKNLTPALKAEAVGILRWAVDGLRAWRAEGLGTPECVQAATDIYEDESNPLTDWLEDRTEIIPDMVMANSVLYSDYTDWAEKEGLRDRECLSVRSFGRYLTRLGFEKVRTAERRGYRGLRLRGCPTQGRL
jgi:putative DNA primase/helicase